VLLKRGRLPSTVLKHMKKPDHLVYDFGKVSQAVEVLVRNQHDARERLRVASEYLFAVDPRGLPDPCRKEIQWIHDMLLRYPAEPSYPSRQEATHHRTRNTTAAKIAARVWNLYHLMTQELESREVKEHGLV